MSFIFDNEMPEWKNQGTEPSVDLKENGFKGGYKPPASVFNWFWSLVSRCIGEIQGKMSDVDDELDNLNGRFVSTDTMLSEHLNDTDNPHHVTKNQVGLGSVDNTSDANKPVSTAMQAALNGRLPLGICTTAGGIQSKVVTIPNFTLTNNCWFCLVFSQSNTATSVTLTVNGIGPFDIYFGDSGKFDNVIPNTLYLVYLDKTDSGTFYFMDLSVETSPGQNSTSLITSGAVYSGLAAKAPMNHTHFYAASSEINGPADSALCLENPVTISLKGGATGSATFDGEYDTEINVTSINPDNLSKVIPVSKGGTGATTVQGARSGLGLAEVASSGIYNDLLAIPFRTVSNSQELRDVVLSLGDEGGAVYLMPGVFDLTDSNFSIGGDGVMLIGSGKGTVLKLGANTRLSFLGNRCGIKNLTLTRETASTMELLLLDSGMETQFADGFIMDNVYIDCININGSTGFIKITSSGAKNFRILNTVINTDQTGVFVNGSAGLHYGIISGCCSNYALTVSRGFALGANINITAG